MLSELSLVILLLKSDMLPKFLVGAKRASRAFETAGLDIYGVSYGTC